MFALFSDVRLEVLIKIEQEVMQSPIQFETWSVFNELLQKCHTVEQQAQQLLSPFR